MKTILPKSKFDLDTPCLVLDVETLQSNLQKMQARATALGKNLRPHAKTHKCSALAKKQVENGAIGICAAKVSEAETLARAGLEGILVTGPLASPAKIERLLDVLAVSPSLMAVVDHPLGIEMLASALHARGLRMDVLLDLDAGLHRTGALPGQALKLAESIFAHPELRLRGVQAYAGQVQHIRSFEDRKAASLKCLGEATEVFRQLHSLDGNCNIFSASGTGSSEIDPAIHELTEMQVGSYAVMDVEYLSIGSAADPLRFSAYPPALRLLTTVVSANQAGFVTVDAGLKSLYKDGGVPQILAGEQAGLEYAWFGDEYGRVSNPGGGALPGLGTVLELVTSHCDPTINLFDRYYLTSGTRVLDAWQIDLRGCSQ